MITWDFQNDDPAVARKNRIYENQLKVRETKFYLLVLGLELAFAIGFLIGMYAR